eukprot:390702-Prymnesium_polylepis.1
MASCGAPSERRASAQHGRPDPMCGTRLSLIWQVGRLRTVLEKSFCFFSPSLAPPPPSKSAARCADSDAFISSSRSGWSGSVFFTRKYSVSYVTLPA